MQFSDEDAVCLHLAVPFSSSSSPPVSPPPTSSFPTVLVKLDASPSVMSEWKCSFLPLYAVQNRVKERQHNRGEKETENKEVGD